MGNEQVKETRTTYQAAPEKPAAAIEGTTENLALSRKQPGNDIVAHWSDTTRAEILQRYPPPMDAERLQGSIDDIEQQIAVYTTIARQFEARHGCSLDVFERRIAEGAVPEHPSWEDALEWGTALDEVERLRTVREALQWILNLLP